MISYAELERAIARWKTRQSEGVGTEVGAGDVVESADAQGGVPQAEAEGGTTSGLIEIGDQDRFEETQH